MYHNCIVIAGARMQTGEKSVPTSTAVCRLLRKLLLCGGANTPAMGSAIDLLLSLMTSDSTSTSVPMINLRTEVLHVLTCVLLSEGP